MQYTLAGKGKVTILWPCSAIGSVVYRRTPYASCRSESSKPIADSCFSRRSVATMGARTAASFCQYLFKFIMRHLSGKKSFRQS